MNGKLNYLIVGMFVMCLVGSPPAMAATRTWDNEAIADNSWDAAANWSADTIPTNSDTARITMIDADYCLIGSLGPICKNLQVGWMKSDLSQGAPGELLMTGGTLYLSGGSATSKVGQRTTGEFTITNGAVTGQNHLDVGDDPGGDGTLVVSGGSLDVGHATKTKHLYVGLDGATGSADISGASTSVHVWGAVEIGRKLDSIGSLTISDGATLDIGDPASTKALKVGTSKGTGSMDISGASTSVNVSGNMSVGTGGDGTLNSDGTFTMSGGTLDIGAPDNPKYLRIGFGGGTGTGTVSGGIVNVSGELRVGASTAITGDPAGGADGLLTLLDGIINVGNVNTAYPVSIGKNYSIGVVEIHDGTINVINGDVRVGETYFQTVGEEEIPRPGTGRLTMTGGLLSISDANSLQIGLNGSTGLVELHGGTIEAGDLEIGVPGSGGTLDFEIGGLLILDGNQMLKVLEFIDDGLFTVYGGVVAKDWFGWSYGYNACGYDGKTFVSVTEVPEPATMMLLGLGGLALLRIRKRR